MPAVSLTFEGNYRQEERDALAREKTTNYGANRKSGTCALSRPVEHAEEGGKETVSVSPKNLGATAGEGQGGSEGFAARARREGRKNDSTRTVVAPSMVLVPEEISAQVGGEDPEAACGRGRPEVAPAKPDLKVHW